MAAISTHVRMRFEVSMREYTLLLKALRQFGGNGQQLADLLENHRLESWKDIVQRFGLYIEANQEETPKGES